MKTKFAIGCLVQWYEIDVVSEYVNTLKEATKYYDGDVDVDFVVVMNQSLEKTSLSKEMFSSIEDKIYEMIHSLSTFPNSRIIVHSKTRNDIYTIADYRREFNERFCDVADVLIWGESDMLVPKQMFSVLDMLHQSQSASNPKYLATFGICKMWDKSWEPLEHPEFSKMPFIENDYVNWWSLKYTMTDVEMNRFNDAVNDLDVKLLNSHKFNGCGLVISSEVIKSGVNIPKSVFFVHEDTAFMLMTKKILGNIPQYHISNILLVHNRNHPKKRNYILGETGDTLNAKRRSNDWYVKANKYSEENCYNIFNPTYKSKTWKDIL